MTFDELQNLIDKYLRNEATESERLIIDLWYEFYLDGGGVVEEQVVALKGNLDGINSNILLN